MTETSIGVGTMKTHDKFDPLIVSDRFGILKNVGPHASVGATIGLYLAKNEIRYAPAIHYRKWFDGRRSLDVSLGNFPSSQAGLTGPIVNAQYSPRPTLFVVAGVCQLHDQWDVIDPVTRELTRFDRKLYAEYGGVGLSGPPGATMWGLEVAGLVGLVVLVFAGVGN